MTMGSEELKTILEFTIVGVNIFFGFLIKFINTRLKEHESNFVKKEDLALLTGDYKSLSTTLRVRNDSIDAKLDEIDKKIDAIFRKLDGMMTKEMCQMLREANGKTTHRKRKS